MVDMTELEQLRMQLLEIFRKSDYAVHCKEDVDGNRTCERFTCSKHEDCKFVIMAGKVWSECNELIESFAKEHVLKTCTPWDSESWSEASGVGFEHRGFVICLGVISDGEREIHFHAVGEEGEVFGKRYSRTNDVKIIIDKASP